ncbi:G1/S regulator [Diplocarpon rosae]|nr:G1/S regulator [Diplocarpon rosae]
MSGKRVPLSTNPNAVNSPFRTAAGAASKQKRSYATIQREEAYGQYPPAKRQTLENFQNLRTPPRQQNSHQSAEGRVFTRRSNASQRSAFEQKLVAVREKPQQTILKADKTSEENLETIRQWQKHYRKIFPTFVFYFESIQEEVRLKYTKQVVALGAREEKFFSNAVTHVVTTRAIPPAPQTSSTETPITSSTNGSHSQHSQPQTINPSLLDRSSESTIANSEVSGRGKFTFEAPISRRLAPHGHDGEIKRQQGRNADVLYRAREMGMKIWALEKLQRMMTTMFDTETGYQTAHGHNTRSNSVSTAILRTTRDTDLSQLLRNERINGPSDRDPTVTTKEITLFKGPFIYIHDIDEKQRPIMVREYNKVAHKEDGDWPQFRSVANGKCPFVDEIDHSRRETEKEKELLRLQRQQEKEKSTIPRTRAAAAVQAVRMQPPRAITGKRTVSQMESAPNCSVTVSTTQANPFAPNNSSFSHKTDHEGSSRGNAFVSRAGVGRLFGGEPVASGLQPSNITSAIRSTMISSTSAQPGAKAGTSKEMHGLQRKVLEKNSGGPGSYGLASSHRTTDINAAVREEVNNRPTKVRGRDKLDLIEEDIDPPEAEDNARKVETTRKSAAVQQRKIEKRDPKPGYCENCQDKFEDFDEHVLSRKHRKFAEKLENWQELDSLLGQLIRPLREGH